MAYRIAQLPMTVNEAEGHFCCFKHSPFVIPIIQEIYIMCLHINWKAHMACDLYFIVTGSHIHWKSGNIMEMVLNRDVVRTGR